MTSVRCLERNVIAWYNRRAFFEAFVSCGAVRHEVFGGIAQFDVADIGEKEEVENPQGGGQEREVEKGG